MEKVIAGKTIHVNEEGFMTDFKEWDNTIGEALAAENAGAGAATFVRRDDEVRPAGVGVEQADLAHV